MEVIIALAIVSILSVIFLNLFAKNYVSLDAFGKRSKNVITVSEVLEISYANIYQGSNEGGIDKYGVWEGIEKALGNINTDKVWDEWDSKTKEESKEVRIKNIDGKKFEFILDKKVMKINENITEETEDIDGFELTITCYDTNNNNIESSMNVFIPERPKEVEASNEEIETQETDGNI